MRILAVDPGSKRAGFATGVVGQRPVAWSRKMRDDDDPVSVAVSNMAIRVREDLQSNWPQLIAIEEAMHPAVSKSAASTIALLRLQGSAEGIAGVYGIKVVEAPIKAVRKHFIGHGNLRRDEANPLIVNRAILLGYLPAGSTDADAANAAAIWDWAGATYGGRVPAALVMHGDVA